MRLVLIYAATLVLAILTSALMRRTILSAAALFLVTGFLAGPVAGFVQPSKGLVSVLAELALVAVLFSDAMRLRVQELRAGWKLPGLALGLGLPLTLLVMAAAAHWTIGLSWPSSLLLAAALSPTDPVLAAAIIGQHHIPQRVRHLLNVESGLNDGLALPLVVVLIAFTGHRDVHILRLLGELALGVLIGCLVPYAIVRLNRTFLFDALPEYDALGGFAMGLLVFALARVAGANEFLAVFAAGITVASLSERVRRAFDEFGRHLTELLKLAAVLVFGASISPTAFAVSLSAGVFIALALFVARPLALAIALARGGLSRAEWLVVAWFGPKGFASVVYGLLILGSGAADAAEVFRIIALVVAVSILLHSSTDVPVAQWFDRHARV